MSRYIDGNDVIEHAEVNGEDKDFMRKLIDYIEDAPSADVVEVCRCKDCKFIRLYDEGDTKYYYCALEDRPNRQWSVDETDFCSWGERREP